MKITELQRKELVRFTRKQFHILSRRVFPNIHQYLHLKIDKRYIEIYGELRKNIIIVYLDNIVKHNPNINEIKENIIYTILHELSHVSQSIDIVKYIINEKYRNCIEYSNDIGVYALKKLYKIKFNYNKLRYHPDYTNDYKLIESDDNTLELFYSSLILDLITQKDYSKDGLKICVELKYLMKSYKNISLKFEENIFPEQIKKDNMYNKNYYYFFKYYDNVYNMKDIKKGSNIPYENIIIYLKKK